MGNIQTIGLKGAAAIPVEIKVRYCLYARKSTESEERQILSIDSQVKEMLQIAERDGLEIAEIRRESHSAKATGQRPVFNEIVNDIKIGKFNGILTWAADRLSRNAGDLGKLVDLMDEKVLLQIRTYGQSFTNSPNEKFMLMILGSHAKLENDNRGVNVRRGLRTRCEMGLRPGVAPIGYLNEKQSDRKCHAMVDPQRAPIIKQIFEKVGNERWSGRKVYHWRVKEPLSDLNGTSFFLVKGTTTLKVNSSLLGMHQIGPLSLAAEVAAQVGLSPNEIQLGLSKTIPFEHRLKPMKDSSGVVTLDDSYNGNPDGVNAVINFLASLKNHRRFYVTPGLVEMGSETELLHKVIGKKLAEAEIEKVVLIKNSVTPFIEQGLKESHYRGEVLWFDDALDAFRALPNLTVTGDVVLLQNDWPDQYH